MLYISFSLQIFLLFQEIVTLEKVYVEAINTRKVRYNNKSKLQLLPVIFGRGRFITSKE